MSNYVIVTPAHNEEAFIEKTIQSMISQTVRPLKWIIVNDASTDRTAEIVNRYTPGHDFIHLVNLERKPGRDFANKVAAFNRGLDNTSGLSYEYLGNLDADLSFDREYFESLLVAFEKEPRLGIAGGSVFTKIGAQFITHDATLDSVGGAVQLFRRECFEEIGGYLALPHGGIDAAAEITARMHGWRVSKLPWLRVLEHRRTGTARAQPLVACFKAGRRFYSLGYGLVFYVLRCVYRLTERPRVLGSCAALFGYLESMIQRRPVVLPREIVRYLQAEQRQKLRQALSLRIWAKRGLRRSSLLKGNYDILKKQS
jgi:poly-beta-1,6-N-acetyl-D-glucosamine synthase